MKLFRTLYAFLASVQFAAFLLFSTAFTVAIATFIESTTNSHLAAVSFVYGHPLFQLLLVGFFLNILLSALKRYPFKKRHIPFLSTHLGLLLIILGIALKNFFGVQGYLVVKEGQTTQMVLLPNTYALKLEKHPQKLSEEINSFTVPLQEKRSMSLAGLSLQVEKMIPHSETHFHSFLYPNHMQFAGIPPIPYTSFPSTLNLGEEFGKAKIFLLPEKKPLFSLLKTSIFTLYSWGSSKPIFHGTLEEIKEPFKVIEEENSLAFYKEETPLAKLTLSEKVPEIALINPLIKDFSITFQQTFALSYDKKAPTLSFLSRTGTWIKKIFPLDFPKEIAIYDRGFGGYTTFFSLPPPFLSLEEQKMIEETALFSLFESYLDSSSSLAAQFINSWAKECKISPAILASLFFAEWRRSHKLLLPASSLTLFVSKQLTKKIPSLPKNLSYFALFALSLPTELEEIQKWKESVPLSLQELMPVYPNDPASFTEALQKLGQAFASLPQYSFPSHYDPALLFCALLAQEGIYPDAFFPSADSMQKQQYLLKKTRSIFFLLEPQAVLFSKNLQDKVKQEHNLSSKELSQLLLASFFMDSSLSFSEKEQLIEAPLVQLFSSLPPPKKQEEAKPLILLNLRNGEEKELIALSYDKQGMGLPWPVLGGKWRIRFQPQEAMMPFSLRLQNAQTIYLPASKQPQKYLADVLIEEKGAPPSWEEISMNHVFERKGWRIYLSSLTPEEEGESKTAVFAVNYDPAKWFFTYPGAIFVALGVTSLFLFWPYRKQPP